MHLHVETLTVNRGEPGVDAQAATITLRSFRSKSLKYFEAQYRMRALILIVSCVIVLAIVQASYLVVDAHTAGPIIRVSDDAHQTAHRSRPPHKAHPQALKDTREHAKVTPAPRQTTTARSVITTGRDVTTHRDDADTRLRLRLCQRRPELPRCRTEAVIDGTADTDSLTSKHSSVKQRNTERKPETSSVLPPTADSVNDTIRQILELAIDQKLLTATSGSSGQGAHHKDTTPSSPDTTSSHHPITSSHQPAKTFIMELPRGHHKLDDFIAISEASVRRGNRKELGYHNYANRNIRLHRQSCASDRDCGTGCCLEMRNGRRTCRRGAMRGTGKRCTSSCMCSPELECWMSANSSRHKQRKTRKLWGRCQDPRNQRNLGPGHFLPTTPPRGYQRF